MVASDYRSIKPGNQYNKYFPNALGSVTLLKKHGSVYDTVQLIKDRVNEYLADTKKLSKIFEVEARKGNYKPIFDFVYEHIAYKEDEDGKEQLRRPARTWADRARGVDCDCYSIFISSILTNLGIPHFFRIIERKNAGHFHHIYIVVPKQLTAKRLGLYTPNYFTLDPVLPKYNQEADKITTYQDFAMTLPIYGLNGLNGCGCGCNGSAKKQLQHQFDALNNGVKKNKTIADGMNRAFQYVLTYYDTDKRIEAIQYAANYEKNLTGQSLVFSTLLNAELQKPKGLGEIDWNTIAAVGLPIALSAGASAAGVPAPVGAAAGNIAAQYISTSNGGTSSASGSGAGAGATPKCPNIKKPKPGDRDCEEWLEPMPEFMGEWVAPWGSTGLQVKVSNWGYWTSAWDRSNTFKYKGFAVWIVNPLTGSEFRIDEGVRFAAVDGAGNFIFQKNAGPLETMTDQGAVYKRVPSANQDEFYGKYSLISASGSPFPLYPFKGFKNTMPPPSTPNNSSNLTNGNNGGNNANNNNGGNNNGGNNNNANNGGNNNSNNGNYNNDPNGGNNNGGQKKDNTLLYAGIGLAAVLGITYLPKLMKGNGLKGIEPDSNEGMNGKKTTKTLSSVPPKRKPVDRKITKKVTIK